jgi:hypothetical protein
VALYNIPSLKRSASRMNKSLVEAKLIKLSNSLDIETFDIFLSQRRVDSDVVQALYDDLTSMGYAVYVDWINDSGLSRDSVNKRTAEILRRRLKNSKSLIYVATENASASKWMPWELGYKDGHNKRVAILPILDYETTSESYTGMEYLGLYPYITKADTQNGYTKLWVHDDSQNWVMLDFWLDGKQPTFNGK